MSDKPKEQTRYEKLRNLYLVIPQAHAGIDSLVSQACQILYARYKVEHDTRILIQQCVMEYYLTGNIFLLPEANWQMLDPDKVILIARLQKPFVDKNTYIRTCFYNNSNKELLHVARTPKYQIGVSLGHSALMFWEDQSFASVDYTHYDNIIEAMQAIYCESLEDMPMHVNDPGILGEIATHRLKTGL